MVILVYNGLSVDCKCIVGYTDGNSLVATPDILHISYAYDTLCKLCGTDLAVFAGTYDNKPCYEIMLPDTFVESDDVQLAQVDLLAGDDPISKLCAEQFFTDRSDVAYWSNLPKIVGPGSSELLRIVRAANPDTVNAQMVHPTDVISFRVPSYTDIKKVYAKDLAGTDAPNDAAKTALFTGKTSSNSEYVVDDAADTDESAESGDSDMFVDYTYLAPQIDLAHIPVDTVFEFYDSKDYVNILRAFGNPVPASYIGGNPNNNKLPIQPNEMEYYTALRNLVTYGICAEHSILTIAELQEAVAEGKTSKYVNSYLTDLAEDAFSLNWRHTGTVAISTSLDADSEGSEDSCANELPGYYTVYPVTEGTKTRWERRSLADSLSVLLGNFTDGFRTIKSYVNTCTINSYGWCEALIRLLRWGERKPSSLLVESLSKPQQYLDMSKMSISDFDGSYDSLVPIVDPESQSSLEVINGIASNPTHFDMCLASDVSELLGIDVPPDINIICGVTLLTKYQGGFTLKTHYDIFTLAKAIEQGDIKVKGISFNKDTQCFSCSESAEAAFSENIMAASLTYGTPASTSEQVVIPPNAMVMSLSAVANMKVSNLQLEDLNVFKMLNTLHMLRGIQSVTDAERALGIENSAERAAAIQNCRTSFGNISTSEVVSRALMLTVVEPFLQLTLRCGESSSLSNYLTQALIVAESVLSSSPIPHHNDSAALSKSFLAGVESCEARYHLTVADTVILNVGYRTVVSPQGKKSKVWYLWLPAEYSLAGNYAEISVEVFINNFAQTYNSFNAKGQLQALLNKAFICTHDSLIPEVVQKLKELRK